MRTWKKNFQRNEQHIRQYHNKRCDQQVSFFITVPVPGSRILVENFLIAFFDNQNPMKHQCHSSIHTEGKHHCHHRRSEPCVFYQPQVSGLCEEYPSSCREAQQEHRLQTHGRMIGKITSLTVVSVNSEIEIFKLFHSQGIRLRIKMTPLKRFLLLKLYSIRRIKPHF